MNKKFFISMKTSDPRRTQPMKTTLSFPQPCRRSGIVALVLFTTAFASTTRAQEQLPAEVKALKESYEREMERVLSPVQSKYIAALEQLQRNYTRAGKLNEAVFVSKEIALAKEWESLPLNQLRSNAKAQMSRDDFKKWITQKTFAFRGVQLVTLQFEEKHVSWVVGNQPQQYQYKVTGDRRIAVMGPQEFKLEFSSDLTTGTFESNVGKYNLTISDRP